MNKKFGWHQIFSTRGNRSGYRGNRAYRSRPVAVTDPGDLINQTGKTGYTSSFGWTYSSKKILVGTWSGRDASCAERGVLLKYVA
jgi:hypothetical protein